MCVSGHEYVIEVSMPYTLTAYHQGFPGVLKTQHGKQCIEVVTENSNSIRYNLERKYMHATVLKFIQPREGEPCTSISQRHYFHVIIMEMGP